MWFIAKADTKAFDDVWKIEFVDNFNLLEKLPKLLKVVWWTFNVFFLFFLVWAADVELFQGQKHTRTQVSK